MATKPSKKNSFSLKNFRFREIKNRIKQVTSINSLNLVKKIQLGKIPEDKFYEYRLQQIFEGYKLDYQSNDQATISEEVVLLDKANFDFIKKSTEKLYAETVAIEKYLKNKPDLLYELGLSEKAINAIVDCDYDSENHIRLMRFDFHPTTEGWKISEVNSDVPAGFQEASLHPQFAAKYFPGYEPLGNFAEALIAEFKKKLPENSTIALIYDSHTVEDMQMFKFLEDELNKHNLKAVHLAPDQIAWTDDSQIENISGIVRHYPAEWLEETPVMAFEKYFATKIVQANHPIALIAQSKRLPLVWNKIPIATSTWQELLPETIEAGFKDSLEWLYKPAFGRVGEGISMPGVIPKNEIAEIKAAAIKENKQWIQQKMFKSLPVNDLHISVGAFAINGKFVGCFSRASTFPLMDFWAKELPVLKEI